MPDCGDPFLSSRIPSAECDNFFTQTTFTCFKTSANGNVIVIVIFTLCDQNVAAAGQYITVRGCAPFTSDVFPGALQKGLAGSYWNVSQWESREGQNLHPAFRDST